MNIDRLAYRTAAAVLLLCVVGIAQAQTRVTPCSTTTPNNALCVSWQPVTTDTSGNTIAGVTYRVEKKTGTAAFATVQASGTATSYYATSLAIGTHIFRVSANCTACTGESSPSNEVNGAATAIPVIPSSPVIIIAATIRADGPPTYRIIQSVTLKQNEYVIVAPAKDRPLFASR